MTPDAIAYVAETPAHDAEIDLIHHHAFGPGRFTRAASKIRENGPHDRSLSFVTLHQGHVIASVRLVPIGAGKGRGLMLGPLAVCPEFKNLGIGRKLMVIAMEAAKAAGHGVIILVGDPPYYGPFGYVKIPAGQVQMPFPVNPERLLAYEIIPGAMAKLTGPMDHAFMFDS
ncbi:GNAT family N-acetyltransferase [Limoniibacter endophyticus]|uniref:N-acetyltransferase GCN5 n=1 Tax=Limoniibacter endophyticus TaxID=1565040 RepID=A0A8J3DQ35_9HYPH|nr:N-acetyltransferase [Limoniibacter endophyticus]GHC65501.1 N-acetyltransferase GCN5 [Limoniibacter endophyticus]